MSLTSALLADARRRAGFSQQELADRAGTSQPAIAKLESGDANPTVGTLERLLGAAGFRLEVALVPLAPTDPVIEAYKRDVDRSLLRANLRRTVDQRLRMNADAVALGAELQRATSAKRKRT